MTPHRNMHFPRRELLLMAWGLATGIALIAFVWSVAGSASSPPERLAALERAAPDFELPGLDGGSVRLSDYRGQVVLINFWASWCQPCEEETPLLQVEYERLHNQGLVIIGVDLRHREVSGAKGDAEIRNFVRRYSVTYPVALDIDGTVTAAYQVTPVPTSFFVAPDGTIRFTRVGVLTEDDITRAFTALRPSAYLLTTAHVSERGNEGYRPRLSARVPLRRSS